MANQITGKIVSIGTIQQLPKKNGNGYFQKREIVLDVTRFDPYTGERGFENVVKLEFSGDKCAELDSYRVGQVATIQFDLQGIRYQDKQDGSTKYMTSIRGYKIEAKQMAQKPVQPQQQAYQPAQAQYQQQAYQNDLPW